MRDRGQVISPKSIWKQNQKTAKGKKDEKEETFISLSTLITFNAYHTALC